MVKIMALPRSPKLSVIYWIYFICGGVYFCHRTPSLFKKLFISSNMALFSTAITASLGYFLTLHEWNAMDVSYALIITEAGLFIHIIGPLILYYFKTKIEAFIDHILGADFLHFSLDTERKYQCGKKIRYEKNLLRVLHRWMLLESFIICLPVCIIPPINVFFLSGRETPHQFLQNHLIPIPYLSQISSKITYSIIYIVEAVCFLVHFYVGIQLPHFILLVVYQINNKIFDYCHSLRLYTEQVDRIVEKRKLQSVTKYLITVVEDYQDFHRTVHLISPYLNLYASSIIIVSGSVQLGAIYRLLSPTVDPIIKIQQFKMVLLVCIHLYGISLAGQMLEQMHDAIAYEVYNLPWYNFTLQQRKLVIIFQLQLARRKTIKNFKTYVTNMKTFPGVLRVVYSFTNILRSLTK